MSVKDLAKDVEGLPAVGTRNHDSEPATESCEAPGNAEGRSRIPEDLAALLSRWESLPENIRSVISTLAGT